MLKLVSFFLFITLSHSYSFSQNRESSESEHIRLVARVIGYEYYIGDEKISANKVDSLLRPNTAAHKQFERAQTLAVLGPIFLIGGGVTTTLFINRIKRDREINLST